MQKAHPASGIPRHHHPAVLIVVLGILNALTPFTIDLYLPAFPQIAADLGVAVSLSVSVYFIGFALGIGAVAAALVGLLDVEGMLPMAVVMATCAAVGWCVLHSGRRALAAATEGASR